jgi:hypothetical protein
MQHAKKNFAITWSQGNKQVTQFGGKPLPGTVEATNDAEAIVYARDQAATLGIDHSKLTCTATELAIAGGE